MKNNMSYFVRKKYILLIFMLTFVIIYVIHCNYYKGTVTNLIPEDLHKYLKFKEKHFKVNGTSEGIFATVVEQNKHPNVKNWLQFGPPDAETTIIAIRVHRDLERLQYLVVSLAQVRDIRTVLLIFSHSFYDERINYLIQQIDFCMVLQLFYPYSEQLFPVYFTGECTNDIRPRETKNHWWWTANVVFDQLVWAKLHKDMVIFIDEASYVLPDFLHMLQLSKLSLSHVTDAGVLSLGRSLASDLDYSKLMVDAWRPLYANGMAFNKTTWRKIAALGEYYCEYCDTSWSSSLLYLFGRLPAGRALAVACMAPRVVSTGGFQSGKHALQNIVSMTKNNRLFPKRVQAVMLFGLDGMIVKNPQASPKGNGGWRYDCDYPLCIHPFLNISAEEYSPK